MSYQFQFDFETLEQKEKRLKDWHDQQVKLDKMFEGKANDYYIYNKYVDEFIDFLPYRLGWGLRSNYNELRLWIKFQYQKFRYGVSDDEVYSLETNIAKYMVPRLQYFKKKGKMGIPMKFLPSNYNNLQDEDREKAEKIGEKEINRILDEMIFAFDYIIDPDKYITFPKSCSWDIKDKNYFNREKNLEAKQSWDEYTKTCDQLETRKKQGLQLFVDHMDMLWI